MSYDLNFWRYKIGVKLDAQEFYQILSQNEAVDGLDELPSDAILDKIADTFKGWKRVDNVSWEKDKAAFQITQTLQYFRVDCYGLAGPDMNALIDIGNEFGCPLYDPQTNERFESPMASTGKAKGGLFGFLKKK